MYNLSIKVKKVYGLKTKDKNNFLSLLLILKFAEYKKSADSLSEILLFLAKYSFLFQNLLIESDLCEAEISQLYIAQENREIGARYLDPKYSMWISADPALGEYIPQAGRDKNEQLPGMGGVYTHINFHLYHYAGNNPVRYVDPDGRERKNLSDEQWGIVQFTKENLVKKLSNIIDQLKSCEGDLEKLDSKIIDAARMYLTSEFGTLPMDTKILADILQEGKEHIEKLTREDFKYDDKTKNYAYTFSFFYTITLGKLFFVAPDSGTIDTKEGIILHESTHYFKWLFTVDPTYDNTEMKQLPDSGFWRYKQHNANNWEYFYEILVD